MTPQCPCGCGRPPRPGKRFAGPHLACLARWRKATGATHAHFARLRAATNEAKRRLAHGRATEEAGEPLTPPEADFWIAARLLGYDNGQKGGAVRAKVGDTPTLSQRLGSVGGRTAARAKHDRACRRLAARHSLPMERARALFSRAYLTGYRAGLDTGTQREQRRAKWRAVQRERKARIASYRGKTEAA